MFAQLKKDGKITPDEVFDEGDIDLSDIEDGGRYYGGFIFVSSLAQQYASFGRQPVTGRMVKVKDFSHTEHFIFLITTRIKTYVLSFVLIIMEMRVVISGRSYIYQLVLKSPDE